MKRIGCDELRFEYFAPTELFKAENNLFYQYYAPNGAKKMSWKDKILVEKIPHRQRSSVGAKYKK